MAELFSRIGAANPIKARIEVSDLSISRGGTPLFAGLSISVSNGDILWIQGDNGIGKTTLLSALAGLNRAETGNVKWLADDQNCQAGDICAYQPHQSYAKAALTAHEDLAFWAKLYGTSSLTGDALEKVGLNEKANVPTKHLSAGQKRRLALAKLIISQKPIWIMDEPAAALDSDGTELIDNLVQTHVAKGGAAIIASHSGARALSGATRALTMRAST